MERSSQVVLSGLTILLIVAPIASPLLYVILGPGDEWMRTFKPVNYRMYGDVHPVWTPKEYNGVVVGIRKSYNVFAYGIDPTIHVIYDRFSKSHWRIAGEAALTGVTFGATWYATGPIAGTVVSHAISWAGPAISAVADLGKLSADIIYQAAPSWGVNIITVVGTEVETKLHELQSMGCKILSVEWKELGKVLFRFGAGVLACQLTNHIVDWAFGEGWDLKVHNKIPLKAVETSPGTYSAVLTYYPLRWNIEFKSNENRFYIDGKVKTQDVKYNYWGPHFLDGIAGFFGTDIKDRKDVVTIERFAFDGGIVENYVYDDRQSGLVTFEIPKTLYTLSPSEANLKIYVKRLWIQNREFVKNDRLTVVWAGNRGVNRQQQIMNAAVGDWTPSDMPEPPDNDYLLNVSVGELQENQCWTVNLASIYFKTIDNVEYSLWDVITREATQYLNFMVRPVVDESSKIVQAKTTEYVENTREWYAEVDMELEYKLKRPQQPMYVITVSPTFSLIPIDNSVWRTMQVSYEIYHPKNLETLPDPVYLIPIVFVDNESGEPRQYVKYSENEDWIKMYDNETNTWTKCPERYYSSTFKEWCGAILKETKAGYVNRQYKLIRIRTSGAKPAQGWLLFAPRFATKWEIENALWHNAPLFVIPENAQNTSFCIFKYVDKPIVAISGYVMMDNEMPIEGAQVSIWGGENTGILLTQELIDRLREVGVVLENYYKPGMWLTNIQFRTGPTGQFWFYLLPGTYTLHLCHPYFIEKNYTINIGAEGSWDEEELVYNVKLERIGWATEEMLHPRRPLVKGFVFDRFNGPISGMNVHVEVSGKCGYVDVGNAVTDTNGYFEIILNKPVGIYPPPSLMIDMVKSGWRDIHIRWDNQYSGLSDNYVIFDLGVVQTERVPSGYYETLITPKIAKQAAQKFMFAIKTPGLDHIPPFRASVYYNGRVIAMDWMCGSTHVYWTENGASNIPREEIKNYITVDNNAVRVWIPYYDMESRAYKMWFGEEFIGSDIYDKIDNEEWIEDLIAHNYWFRYQMVFLRRTADNTPVILGEINLQRPVYVTVRAYDESNKPLYGVTTSLRGYVAYNPRMNTVRYLLLYDGLSEFNLQASKEGYYTLTKKLGGLKDKNYVDIKLSALPAPPVIHVSIWLAMLTTLTFVFVILMMLTRRKISEYE